MNKRIVFALVAAIGSSQAAAATTFFHERFDDSGVGSRGWFDNTNVQITSDKSPNGGSGSLKYTFRSGATQPTSGGAMRRHIPETDSIYIRYYTKFSSNWVGSQKADHPHIFYFLTNKDGDYTGLAQTHLTAYLEENSGRMTFKLQDVANIDQNRINSDLTNVTERRGVAGCNGNSDGYSGGCYKSGSLWRNTKTWMSKTTSFTSSNKTQWHLVEAYIKLNSIVNNKGVNDGVLQAWVNGQQVINHTNVLLRTAANADMRFKQVAIGPYIGVGSPVEQSFWIDELVVADKPIGGAEVAPPSPPRNLRTTAP